MLWPRFQERLSIRRLGILLYKNILKKICTVMYGSFLLQGCTKKKKKENINKLWYYIKKNMLHKRNYDVKSR